MNSLVSARPPLLVWPVALFLHLFSHPARAALPAFPGAAGSGSTTPGGRGGQIHLVTNRNDSGPGSLRAACEAEGPRMVIVRVAGTIDLERPIHVRHPFMTLAAQKAPGDGICLRNDAFLIATHDVTVRYLRSRLGDVSKQETDCISIGSGAQRVILDHCSATWSIDEALSLSGDVSETTLQWCLIGEALNHSVHKKGSHGYGSLARANGPISMHHNLWAHNNARNPRLGDNYGRSPFPTFDLRNNVIYDYGATCSGLTQGRFKVNYVANYVRPGPSSRASTPIHVGAPSAMQFFIQDNVFEGHDLLTQNNRSFFDRVAIEGVPQVDVVADPFPAPPVTTVPAAEALELVLDRVGACLPVRDSVDARIIEQVRKRTGSIIDSQTKVSGWAALNSAEPPADHDRDGMPDAWELERGLDPRDSSDAAEDRDGDGYTNVEEYLNEGTL